MKFYTIFYCLRIILRIINQLYGKLYIFYYKFLFLQVKIQDIFTKKDSTLWFHHEDELFVTKSYVHYNHLIPFQRIFFYIIPIE